MKDRAGHPASGVPFAESVYFAVWVAVLIVAVILQVLPIVLVVAMLSLAIGIPTEVALNVVPVVFIAALYLACVVAAKFAGRRRAGWRAGRSDEASRPDYFR